MKIAVIDMGTNTFHLLIVDVNYQDYKIVYREKTAVKIGKGGISHGLITAEAQERAIATVSDFKLEINRHEITNVYATATSAIRNARNGMELLDRIKHATGVSAKIISGREEAEYIYFGVTQALKIGSRPALIMDIGGGSIEFIIANDRDILWLRSFEIGGQRLVDKYHENDPITEEEIRDLEAYLFENLQELFDKCAEFQPNTLVGSSGTFDTISDIYQIQNGITCDEDVTEFPFSFDRFEPIFYEVIAKTREERLKMPGMSPMRVDMIVVAFVLIKFVVDSIDIKAMRISAYALKEGVLLKTIDSLKKDKILRPGVN